MVTRRLMTARTGTTLTRCQPQVSLPRSWSSKTMPACAIFTAPRFELLGILSLQLEMASTRSDAWSRTAQMSWCWILGCLA